MRQSLERKSWIAGVIGTIIGSAAFAWSIWTYFFPHDASPQTSSPSAANTGDRAIIVQGSGNTIVAPQQEGSFETRKAPRFFEVEISDQALKIEGNSRHEVHYPQISGTIPSDTLALTNHLLKRSALTEYEYYSGMNEVRITYKIGLKEFNLIGINYNIFIWNDGAAHPQTTTNAITINLETGHELKLKNILRTGYRRRINELVRENLIRQDQYFPCENKKTSDSKEQRAEVAIHGILKEILRHSSDTCFSSVTDDSQYYLTDTSLVLVFPKYSIAPGASGDLEVPITFKEIQNLLSPDSPLQRFL